MKRALCAILFIVVWGCSKETRVTQALAPRELIPPNDVLGQFVPQTQYSVVKLPSLGGTISRGNSINERGWIAGTSFVTNNAARHAALWREGSVLDLGTLGGPTLNSSVQWPGQNNQGMVVGISHTAVDDTLGETWSCSAFLPFVGKTCVGFFWENGVMTALPTLGGDNGFATGVNNLGQVVGWAETKVHDPTCDEPQMLQFHAVMWEPKKGTKTVLQPLKADSASAATAINDRGQAVGISGECDVAVGRFSARHAVIWEKGETNEIPNLGGISWHTPMAINELGDVVGFSNPPGDPNGEFIVHAFFWSRRGGIKDLGTLPGDSTSQALGINARGQVVGLSTSKAGTNHAFIWQDGVMTDLQKLMLPGFADSLISAQDINDHGRITGRLFERSTGQFVTFVATPVPR